MTRYVFHVDLDQFIAAVEVLRRPELRGRPVVVGGDGDPAKRGVVSTASYEARAFGIRSGMALRSAYRRCPDAVFLPVDADTYLAKSAEVMSTLRSLRAVVEPAGWDEAFMGVDVADPGSFAIEVQRTVLERTQLWCSIGIGDNKLRAKIASDLGKPAGIFLLTAGTWDDVMGARPTDSLWGVGRKTARKLEALGIRTVDGLARADDALLAAAFGPTIGPWLRRLGLGEDDSPVTAEPYIAKGHGREHTFQRDLERPDDVRREVDRLARELATELLADRRAAVRVVVKVRFAPFVTSTHGVRLDPPSLEPDRIVAAAEAALERFELDRPVRLVGVRAELDSPA